MFVSQKEHKHCPSYKMHHSHQSFSVIIPVPLQGRIKQRALSSLYKGEMDPRMLDVLAMACH
jgi:hypothetical protein